MSFMESLDTAIEHTDQDLHGRLVEGGEFHLPDSISGYGKYARGDRVFLDRFLSGTDCEINFTDNSAAHCCPVNFIWNKNIFSFGPSNGIENQVAVSLLAQVWTDGTSVKNMAMPECNWSATCACPATRAWYRYAMPRSGWESWEAEMA